MTTTMKNILGIIVAVVVVSAAIWGIATQVDLSFIQPAIGPAIVGLVVLGIIYAILFATSPYRGHLH